MDTIDPNAALATIFAVYEREATVDLESQFDAVRVMVADRAGMIAAVDGKAWGDNPYTPHHSPEWRGWRDGWWRAMHALMDAERGQRDDLPAAVVAVRSDALAEAKLVCETYHDELASAGIRERVKRCSGVGADEVAVLKCAARIGALTDQSG
jgi:hypothetical protein